MQRYYKPSASDFQDWLDHWVWINHITKVPRREYIPRIAEETTKWMKQQGYIMEPRWKKGELIIAKWMYAIHIQEVARRRHLEPIQYPEIQHRDWPEDQDTFDIELPQDKIETFLKRFRNHEDFDIDTWAGARVINEFRTLLYHYIDLEESPHGRRIALLFDTGSDSDGNQSNHDDFLLDIINGLHGAKKKILGVNTL